MLSVENVKKYYRNKRAVDCVNFSLDDGAILALLGETGSGKSTLARTLNHLEIPDFGRISLNGKNIDELYSENRFKFRRMVQMVYQNPFETFDMRSTIGNSLERVLELHKVYSSKKDMVCELDVMLEEFGLSNYCLIRYPHELSGGQLQRISMLLSMMLKPSIIIADEPVSMLDVSLRADVINLLYTTCLETGTSLIFISHDITLAHYIADNIAVMYLGKIVEMAPSDTIMHHPMHPYTKALVGASLGTNPLQIKPPDKIRSDWEHGCAYVDRCPLHTPTCDKGFSPKLVMGTDRMIRCFLYD
jgi:peptide/nickel transport system ATP-binding protein